MKMAELLQAVVGLTVVLVLVFVIWRRRRLHLRRGDTDLEHFGH
jgi:hypothetical protein